MYDQQGPIVIVQEFEAPVSVVWEAIIDPERMRGWCFHTIEEFRPELDFEARFKMHFAG